MTTINNKNIYDQHSLIFFRNQYRGFSRQSYAGFFVLNSLQIDGAFRISTIQKPRKINDKIIAQAIIEGAMRIFRKISSRIIRAMSKLTTRSSNAERRMTENIASKEVGRNDLDTNHPLLTFSGIKRLEGFICNRNMNLVF